MRKLFLCGAVVLAACSDGTGPTPADNKLSVGDSRQVGGQERATLRVDGGPTGGEFVLIPFYADSFYVNPPPANGLRTDSTVRQLQVTATANGAEAIIGPPNPALLPEAGAMFSRSAAGGGREARPDERFHLALRQREQAALAALNPGRLSPVEGGGMAAARFSAAAIPPQIGDIVRYNTNARQACSAPDVRAGRVAAVSTRAIVVADTTNPAGGFTDAEYVQFGKQFDDLVYDVDVQNFGVPGDLDKNGRVVIFFTRAVNDLTPQNSSSYVGGFFFGRDLFPAAAAGSYKGCVGSNEAEMFYMLVPDPARAGTADSPFSKTRVSGQTIGVLAHEFQHLINLSRRQLQTDEDVWLNEGLSHIAEELMFYKVSGLQSRTNIGISQIASGAPSNQAFNEYENSNFNRLNAYLREPELNSPYADNDSLTTRGATWQLLRYLADRKGGDQAATFRSLVDTKEGMRNLQSVFGQDALTLVRDWTVAQYADDANILSSGGSGSRYDQPSWNFRAIFPGYKTNNGQFPLKTRSLATSPVSFTLTAGGAAYLRFRVEPNATATITTSSGSAGAVPASLQMTLLRTK